MCTIYEENSKRIYDRGLTSGSLQPGYGVRPQQTRQTLMKMSNSCPESTVPLHSYPTYDPTEIFYPGNSNAPWSGFVNNVDVESELKNQTIALQRNDIGSYVPASSSELYNSHYTPHVTPVNHALLFKEAPVIITNHKQKFNKHNNMVFYENTRFEVKNGRLDL